MKLKVDVKIRDEKSTFTKKKINNKKFNLNKNISKLNSLIL